MNGAGPDKLRRGRLVSNVVVSNISALYLIVNPAGASTQLPTTEAFTEALTTCATGSNIEIQANLLGSVSRIYNGQRTKGIASFKTITKFISLFPPTDRAKVYDLYTQCIVHVLGRSVDTPQPRVDTQSIVKGTVTDAVSGLPIPGVEVRIEYSGHILGIGTTDLDGRYATWFKLPSDSSSQLNIAFSVNDQTHTPQTKPLEVQRSNTETSVADAALLSPALAICRSKSDRIVVVGHFLSPIDRPVYTQVPEHLAKVFEYAINSRLQTRHLPRSVQPAVLPCESAQPQTPELGSNFARALRADAFISGNISGEASGQNFKIVTYVSDAYGIFDHPEPTASDKINVNDPRSAVLKGETNAAILAAVAAGLANSGDCINSLTVVSLAEEMVDSAPPYLTNLRNKCELTLPNKGLLGVY
jgi:hypothetical protein